MTNLDRAGYELREDLRLAARRLIVRQEQRRNRLRRTIALGIVLAALGGGVAAAVLFGGSTAPAPAQTITVVPGTGTGTGTPPSTQGAAARARSQMSVFSRRPPRRAEPPAVVLRALRSYARSPGQDFGALESSPRLLTSSGRQVLYAAATDRGYVCFAVTNGSSAAGTCAADLAVAPITTVVIAAERTEPAVVAGVARDGVVAVRAVGRNETACQAPVVENGFLCTVAGGASSDEIIAYVVTFRDGRVTTLPF